MKQEEALQLLKLGKNVFLTGSAGSGKTYLLNRYIHHLRTHSVTVATTASTGLAATHLNGRTVHSWSGIGVREELSDNDLNKLQKDKRLRKRYLKAKVLIIDEISMLHAYQLDLIDQVARHMLEPLLPFGGLQVVLCGDFFQLPPVAGASDKAVHFAFDSAAWKNAGFHTCYLHEQHRQGKDELLTVLNDIRNGTAGEHTKVPLRTRYKKPPAGNTPATRLFARNINVDHINEQELNALKGREHTFRMNSEGSKPLVDILKRSCPATAELKLKVGAKVMFIKNSIDGHYVNGTLGLVESIEEDQLPMIKTYDGKLIEAEPEDWKYEENDRVLAVISQLPLKLAWAITVHKSQGMTLDAAETDLSDAFEPGMGYVALSRVRSLSGLNLLGLNETALQVHPHILDKDNEFKAQSELATDELKQLTEDELRERQHHTLVERFEGKQVPLPKAINKPPEVAYTKAQTQPKAKLPDKAYQPWTDEDDQLLAELYNEGKTTKEIANTLERGKGAIRSRLRKQKLIR